MGGSGGCFEGVVRTHAAMLYLVGLGLCDATDITVKGLDVVKRASRVYLEAYTSILTVGKEALVGSSLIFLIIGPSLAYHYAHVTRFLCSLQYGKNIVLRYHRLGQETI